MSSTAHPGSVDAARALPAGIHALLITRALSALGASMTSFAINVWVFDSTRSYVLFAGLTLLTSLPNLLLAPFIGAAVDRCNKRTLLIACEALTALTVAVALIFHWQGALGLWQAGLVVLSLSVTGALRWTLMGATIGSLVPTEALNRVNGFQQSLEGITFVAGPLLGASCLHMLGPGGVFAIDIVCSAAAIVAARRLDAAGLASTADPRDATGFLGNAAFGLRWIAAQAPLKRLLGFVTVYNLAGGTFTVSFVPHFLAMASPEWLGAALALEGGGALVGGALVARTRFSSRSAEMTVYLCALAFGVLMACWGATRHPAAGLVIAGLSGLLVSVLIASLQSTWQAQVPPEIQGRVFAARRMVSYSLIPFATLASIPAATQLAPLVESSARLTTLWGTGEAGGLGLLLSVCGVLLVPAALLAALSARRRVSGARALPT